LNHSTKEYSLEQTRRKEVLHRHGIARAIDARHTCKWYPRDGASISKRTNGEGRQMTKKKTIEFEEGWADELIADGSMTEEEVASLVRIITEFVEDGTIFEDVKDKRH
jgi:uncharacterized protein YfdQ (DUF2303 family)